MQDNVREWLFDNNNFQTPVVLMPGHYESMSISENTYKLEVYAYQKTTSQNFFTKYENIKRDEKGAYCHCNLATIPVYAQLGPNIANGPIFDFDEIRQSNGYGRLCLRILYVEEFDNFTQKYEDFLYEHIYHQPNIETKKDVISTLKKVFSVLKKAFFIFVKVISFIVKIYRLIFRISEFNNRYRTNYVIPCKKCGSAVENSLAYCEYCGTQN